MMEGATTQHALVYKLAPEWRRCCCYVMVGAFVFAPLSTWSGLIVGEHSPAAVIGFSSSSALAAVAWCWVSLRWRLQVGENGLARRRLLRWDWWTWHDFESGRVCKAPGYVLRHAARSRWSRRLNLSLLAPEDRKQVFAAINAHYRLPAPPPVPETLKLRWGFRREAVLDAAGLRLSFSGVEQVFRWDEVRQILIVRDEPLRRDFQRVDIDVPDPAFQVSLRLGPDGSSWKGATAEEINEFLHQHAPPDKIEVAIAGDYASSPVLRGKTLAELKARRKQNSDWRLAVVPAVIVLLIAPVIFVVSEGLVKGLVLAALMDLFLLGFTVPIYVLGQRDLRKRIQQIEATMHRNEPWIASR